jgi:hypothetical protein
MHAAAPRPFPSIPCAYLWMCAKSRSFSYNGHCTPHVLLAPNHAAHEASPRCYCGAEWGKRYGKNQIPQSYSTPGHVWQNAKVDNWGAWSCCGGTASSAPCQSSTLMASETCAPGTVGTGVDASVILRGVGAQIQFLIADKVLTTRGGRGRKDVET